MEAKILNIDGHWFALYHPGPRVTTRTVQQAQEDAGDTRPCEFIKEGHGKNRTQRLGSKKVAGQYPAILTWANLRGLKPMDWIMIRIKD